MSELDKKTLDDDLNELRSVHGINDELICSIQSNKLEARAHIRFFKTMTLSTSVASITMGLVIAGISRRLLKNDFFVLSVFGSLMGISISIYFTFVFIRMIKAIQATEYVAQKHNLI